jgi:hypothetical protein
MPNSFSSTMVSSGNPIALIGDKNLSSGALSLGSQLASFSMHAQNGGTYTIKQYVGSSGHSSGYTTLASLLVYGFNNWGVFNYSGNETSSLPYSTTAIGDIGGFEQRSVTQYPGAQPNYVRDFRGGGLWVDTQNKVDQGSLLYENPVAYNHAIDETFGKINNSTSGASYTAPVGASPNPTEIINYATYPDSTGSRTIRSLFWGGGTDENDIERYFLCCAIQMPDMQRKVTSYSYDWFTGTSTTTTSFTKSAKYNYPVNSDEIFSGDDFFGAIRINNNSGSGTNTSLYYTLNNANVINGRGQDIYHGEGYHPWGDDYGNQGIGSTVTAPTGSHHIFWWNITKEDYLELGQPTALTSGYTVKVYSYTTEKPNGLAEGIGRSYFKENVKMSDFYSNGAMTGAISGAPASGEIKLSNYYGKTRTEKLLHSTSLDCVHNEYAYGTTYTYNGVTSDSYGFEQWGGVRTQHWQTEPSQVASGQPYHSFWYGGSRYKGWTNTSQSWKGTAGSFGDSTWNGGYFAGSAYGANGIKMISAYEYGSSGGSWNGFIVEFYIASGASTAANKPKFPGVSKVKLWVGQTTNSGTPDYVMEDDWGDQSNVQTPTWSVVVVDAGPVTGPSSSTNYWKVIVNARGPAEFPNQPIFGDGVINSLANRPIQDGFIEIYD